MAASAGAINIAPDLSGLNLDFLTNWIGGKHRDTTALAGQEFTVAAQTNAAKEESRQKTTRIAYIATAVVAVLLVAIIIFKKK